MRRLVIIALPLLVCFAAGAGRDRPNVNCQLPQETPVQLDLRNPEDRRHLSDEALRAEDIAVRYSDSDAWKVPDSPQGMTLICERGTIALRPYSAKSQRTMELA